MQFFQRLSTCPTIPEVISEAAKARAARWPDTLPLDVWCRPSILLALRERGYSGAVPVTIGLQRPALSHELRVKQQRTP
jgi:hypothetical protein